MTQGLHARAALLAPLVASGLALSGCMSSPTYGTDKTASAQLVGDLSNALSFSPPKRDPIDYKPRPDLVKPAPGTRGNLPAPQDSITQTASAQWPESPEQKRARLREEASKNFEDTNFQAQIVDDVQPDPVAVRRALEESGSSHPPRPDGGKDVARRGEVNRRLVENRQGDPTTRKYLSEPPLDYRVAASSAPQGDLGEDEYKKERRLKRQATKKSRDGWFDWLPW